MLLGGHSGSRPLVVMGFSSPIIGPPNGTGSPGVPPVRRGFSYEPYNPPMSTFMIGNRMCAFALSSALAIICSAPPAIAAKFDGSWNMVAVTTSGHCGTIPIGVGISRGRLYSTGGASFGTAFRSLPDSVGGASCRLGPGPDECSGWPACCLWDRTVQSSSGQRDLGRYRAFRCLLWRLERRSFLAHHVLAHAI